MEKFKVSDWDVFDLRIGQIKELYDNGTGASISDGSFQTSGGRLLENCRPLTLRNKAITESFDYYYRELDKIDGNSGFNFPDISRHFQTLCLEAIDAPDEKGKVFYDRAQDFVQDARDYKSIIQGVRLFRRAA